MTLADDSGAKPLFWVNPKFIQVIISQPQNGLLWDMLKPPQYDTTFPSTTKLTRLLHLGQLWDFPFPSYTMQNEQTLRHPLVAWLVKLWRSFVGRLSPTTPPPTDTLPEDEERVLASNDVLSPSDLLEEFYESREVENKVFPARGHSGQLNGDIDSLLPMSYVDPTAVMRNSPCGRENVTIGLAEELLSNSRFPGDEVVIYGRSETSTALSSPFPSFYTPRTEEETFKEFALSLFGDDQL